MWLRCLALILVYIAAFPAAAQTLTTPSAVPAAAPTSPLGWNTPQSTVQSFLSDASQGDFLEATKGMDLSDIPFPVRDTQGVQYARMLAAVLSRAHHFDVAAVPATTLATSISIPVKVRSGKTVGSLVLVKSPVGAWQFSATTVSEIPKLWDAVQYQPQNPSIGIFAIPTTDRSMAVRAAMPTFMLHSFLWLEIWQWVGLAALAVFSLILACLIRALVRLVMRVFFKRWQETLHPHSANALRRSAGLLSAATLWWALYQFLGLQGMSVVLLVSGMKLVWVVGAAWLLDAIFETLLDLLSARATHIVSRADQILIPIAKKFIKFIIFLGATLAFAASMSVNVAGLVAGLGIGGLVIALAGKDSVENIFGSLTIIFDMPFGIGDWIKLGDVEGTVEEINLRSTRVRTFQDTVITLPNSNLIKASVENFGARRYRRMKFTLTLSYVNRLEGIEGFVQGIRKILDANEKVRPDNSYVNVQDMTDTGIAILIQCYLVTSEYSEELQLRSDLISKILRYSHESNVLLGSVPWNPVLAPRELLPETSVGT